MKFLTLLLVCLSAVVTFAKEDCTTSNEETSVQETMVLTTDVPKHLEGATITVRLKDGRESTVPAEMFKVVPRKQQVIVTATKSKEKTMCKSTAENQKNRVSLIAGKGALEGLDTEKKKDEVVVESRVGVLGGLMYQRLTDIEVFGMPLSVGGQLQSNESALGTIGLDF